MLTDTEKRAMTDWMAGLAYIDNQGNYHRRPISSGNGPIAPWNKEIKAKYPTVTAFHRAAHAYKSQERI